MIYHEDIHNSLKHHIQILENLGNRDTLPKKVTEHLNISLKVLNEIEYRQPENYRQLIEYLNNEGRNFGWSYPENSEEEKCETYFWKLTESIKMIIQKIPFNERLHFFGYLDDYKNLKPNQKNDRENIEVKLFMK